jgi:hypothetical protein
VNLQTGGAITVVGWDKEVVSIRGVRHGIDERSCDVEIDERSSGVYIGSKYTGSRRHRSGSVDLEIKVPRRYDLHLESMGGVFTIDNVEGEINGKTMGGKLKLSRLKGNLDLETMGGPIELRDSRVDGKVHTMGGEVIVENVEGKVDASSMGGKVIQKNVTSGSGKKQTEVKISTMGGDIDVDDAPAGADLHTMGGKIHVASAAGFVKAKTMGGNVTIDAIDGGAEATTMGGDVAVTMTGDPAKGKRNVKLSSMGGDITLTVPDGLSMDIDIELAYTRGKEGEYRIVSDFPLEQDVSKDWEYDDGTPRKIIHGTGTVGGGKNRVILRTVNGNVTIKKL